MSTVLPQSQLGLIKTKTFAESFLTTSILDERATKVLNLEPVPTVWGRKNGRPIYDRLPGVSEAYREEYAGEVGTGLVYIDPQRGVYRGAGSLEVGAWQDDPRVLVINSGVITWAKGQIPTSTLALNLETVIDGGVEDGSYQVGYYLDEEVTPEAGATQFSVEAYSLAASSTIFTTNRAAKDYPLSSALSDYSTSYWTPSNNNDAGPYSDGSWIVFDFTTEVVAASFELVAPNSTLATARCALYRSNDAISWELADSVSSREGVWTLSNGGALARYYRIYFWGGKTALSKVRYTGNAIYPNRQPTGPVSSAKIFLEPEFDQIDRPHILLGLITVRNFEIAETRDVRRFTSRKYEPVASWLTDFQDSTLRKLITDIVEYSDRYLAPSTAASGFYEDLSATGIVLAPETSTPTILFPGEIELKPPTEVFGQAVASSVVNPPGIYLLGQPSESSDLATKEYIDTIFVPSLDNGNF